jgi:hypothetical protein
VAAFGQEQTVTERALVPGSGCMQTLKLAKPGFIVEQSANLGMAGVRQVMASVIRQVVGRMEGPLLLSICGSIRQFML